MPTLLLAEHDNKSLKDATNKALTAARQIGADVHILVAGHNCKPAAEAAATGLTASRVGGGGRTSDGLAHEALRGQAFEGRDRTSWEGGGKGIAGQGV